MAMVMERRLSPAGWVAAAAAASAVAAVKERVLSSC